MSRSDQVHGLKRPLAGTSEAAILRAVRAAATAVGLPAAGATVLRCSSSTLVTLPQAKAVARLFPQRRAATARREIDVAVILRAAGVPAARLVGSGDQPVATGCGPVTFWGWLTPVDAPVTAATLGALARRLHHATAGRTALRPADPLGAARALLDEPQAIRRCEPRDLRLLHTVLDRYSEAWADVVAADPLGQAVIHADLHSDNVVSTASGPYLVDLELAGTGPCSYDLAPLAVATRRYGAPPQLDAASRRTAPIRDPGTASSSCAMSTKRGPPPGRWRTPQGPMTPTPRPHCGSTAGATAHRHRGHGTDRP